MKKQNLKFLRWTGWMPVYLIVMAGFTWTACTDDENEKDKIYEPFTTDLSFSAIEKDTTLVFHVYGDWKAVVTKSDVAEIKSEKIGIAGEIKMEIHLFENKTFAPREAEILINDGRTNVFKIKQLAAKRAVNYSKALNFIQADTVFTDTVTVTSNVAWEIGTQPEWIKSWKKIDPEQMPEEGVNTEITLVFIADNNLFTTAGMKGEVSFKDKAGNDYPLPAEFAGFTPSIGFDTEELILARSETGDGFRGKVMVTSNVAWSVDQTGAGFVGKVSYDESMPGNALESNVLVWVDIDPEQLDSDPLTGELVFGDEKTGITKNLKLKFIGTGADYIDFERDSIFEKRLDASPFNNQWEDIPNAKMSIDFKVFLPEGKSCNPIIIGYDGMNPYKMDRWSPWAGAEEKTTDGPETRAPIVGKTYELWVKDRRQEFGSPQDKERSALLFVVPETVTVDDILEETDTGEVDEFGDPIYAYSFKEGYGVENGCLFYQKGLVIEYYLIIEGIEEGSTLSVPAAGESRELLMETDCETWTMYLDGEYMNPDVDWVSLDEDSNGMKLVVKKNDTGKSRKTQVSFRAYRGDDVEEQVLLSFWISQEK